MPSSTPTSASSGASGLSAFDLSDGQLLWTQPFGTPPRSLHGPLHLQDGFAYGGIQNTYNDRTIVVIDLETGGVLVDHPVDYTVETVRPLGAGHLVAGWKHGIYCYEVS